MSAGESNFALDYNFKYQYKSRNSSDMLCVGSRYQLLTVPVQHLACFRAGEGIFLLMGKLGY